MIGDKADRDEGDDVRVGTDIRGLYQILDLEEVQADEIGTEEFPQFGEFIAVRDLESDTACFLSWYKSLDEDLAEIIENEGDKFRILECYKNQNDRYEVKAVDPT